MALASTPDLASYGFGYRWAQQAYVPGPSQGNGYEPSSIRTGNTTPEGGGDTAIGAFIIKGSAGSQEYPAHLNGKAAASMPATKWAALKLSTPITLPTALLAKHLRRTYPLRLDQYKGSFLTCIRFNLLQSTAIHRAITLH